MDDVYRWRRETRGWFARLRSLARELMLALMLVLVARGTAGEPKRDEALRHLRVMASEDADNGIARRTGDAVSLCRQKWPEVDVMEAARAYDAEYTRVDRGKLFSLPKSMRDIAGWGVALVVVVVAVLKDAITKGGARILAVGFAWFYPRVASSRLFRPLGVRAYRTKLAEALRYIKPTIGPNRKIEAQQVYVPLKLAGNDRASAIDALSIVRANERLMILGAPGAGKSMLLRHLAFTYAQGAEREGPEPLPVLLELVRLTSDPTIEGFLGRLTEAFSRAGFPNARSFVEHALQRGELMLLLDGLDEVTAQSRSSVVQVVKDALETYPQCKAVITCRTAVYHNEFAGGVTTYEIAEFTDQQIRRFLRMYMTRATPERSVEHLVQTLRDRPAILSLARNPLLLSIIEYLYSDTPIVLPHSRAEFYQKALDVLLQLRDEERGVPNEYRALDKRAVLQRLSLEFQKHVRADVTRDRRTLEAEVVHAETRSILPGLGLVERDALPLLDEIIDRSSLLLRVDGGSRYQFAHLTLQEFLAAEALRSRESLLVERWRTDPQAWREPAKLWCNMSGNASSFLRDVRQHDRLMAVECLADAQEVEPDLANEIIAEAQFRLASSEDSKAWGAALAAIAASARARSETALAFLLSSLNQTDEASRSLAAAEALSLTNLPRAAEALSESVLRGGGESHVRALARMGDLAVPHVVRVARAGRTAIIDQLVVIGTPVAVRALAELTWESERDALTQRAALNLGSLFRNAQTLEELNEYRAPPRAEHVETLPWVFGPFGVPDAIKRVAGRVAYVISRTPADRLSDHSPHLDARLVVPLCTIVWAEDPPEPGPSTKLMQVLASADPGTLEEAHWAELKSTALSGRQVALMQSLPVKLQSEVVRRRFSQRRPIPQDWLELHDKTTYELGLSWHHRVTTILTLAIAMLAVWGARHALDEPSNYWFRVLTVTALVMPLLLWLHQAGTARSPFFLYSVLLGGPLAFLAQRRNARMLLAGTHRYLESKVFLVLAGAAIVGASGFVGVLLGEHVSSWRGMGDEVLAIRLGGFIGAVVGGLGAGVVMGAAEEAERAEAFELIFGGLGLTVLLGLTGLLCGALGGTLVGALFGSPGTGSLTGAVVGLIVPGLAGLVVCPLIALALLLRRFEERDSNGIAVVLILPVSLWLPLAAVFVTSLAGRYLDPVRVVLAWIGLAALIAGLWWRSRALENRARNPLRGILDLEGEHERRASTLTEDDDIVRALLGRTVPTTK